MSHTDLRSEFHHDIESIRNDISRLAATVVELIPRATDILLEQDLEGAEYVLRGDDEIDARAITVEENALRMLALQAPVAQDLRQIAAALKLSPEIERSADLCCNICKAARRIYGHELDPKLRGLIQRMSDQATFEYREVLEAYLALDETRASAIANMDEYLDDLHRQFIQQIFESHAAGTIDVQVGIQLAMVGRFYERLGDHAVNFSHRVLYIATGWLPEHDALRRHRDRVADDDANAATAAADSTEEPGGS
jgi:phosphate transport system protein